MKSLLLLIPFIIFGLNEYYNNKIVRYINKFYKCCKIITFILPIVIIYINPDLWNKIKIHFKDLNLDTHDTNKLINNFILPTKNKKRNVSESKKKYIASNQQWKCKKCNSILDATYEIDHIIPLYKGGDNELANLEALCRNCHGNKTLLDKII